MKSIRWRLILTLVVCLSTLFVVGSVGLYLYARRALAHQFDEALTAKLCSYAEMAEYEAAAEGVFFEFDFTEYPLPEFQPSPDAEYYQIWLPDGSVLVRSPSLSGGDLQRIEAGQDVAFCRNILLPDGRQGRAAALWFSPKVDPDPDEESLHQVPEGVEVRLYMMLAVSRERLDFTLTALLAGFAFMGALLLTGLIFTVRWTVGRGLKPLERIAKEATEIDSKDLSHRFQAGDLPNELSPIANRLNELLGRIDEAFTRERRFNADVAHELNTPISELRALAEVALNRNMKAAASDASRTYFSDVLEIAKEMESMVKTLMSLVQCESDRQKVKRASVDLTGLVRKAAAPFQEMAGQKQTPIEFRLPESAHVESDGTLLSLILKNLFSNAVSHTPKGGSIHCEVAKNDRGYHLSLRNTNDLLVQEDLAHLFEPFWQKDPARTHTTRHGLGLTIVAAYAEFLGIKLSASLPEVNIFEISFLIS